MFKIKALLTIALILLCVPAWATSVTVCDSGCTYTTIAAALTAVGNGNHTVTVQGTYTAAEALTVSKTGADIGTELTIQASGTQNLGNVTLSSGSRYIKIKGFTFTAKRVLDYGSYNVVEDNTFIGTRATVTNSLHAYMCYGCTYGTFQNNTVRHWHYDLLVYTTNYSSNVLIYNNIIF